MPTSHNHTDKLLDELITHHTSTSDDPDTEILQQLVDYYRTDSLPASTKHRILNRARVQADNEFNTMDMHPSYRGRVWKLAAALTTIIGAMFLLNTFRFADYHAVMVQQTTIPQSIALPTPTPSPANVTLLYDNPQISPAFGFEYGGYTAPNVTQSTLDMMSSSNMGWVAFKLIHSPESDTLGIRRQIATAHQHGFKVLLSIQGSEVAMGNIPESYTQSYIDYVTQFVLSGVDAIEIWSDANLDRSWSPELGVEGYADLLIQTATAIRQVKPDTVIISGAPAPTGAESAFPDQVINDDSFVQQLMDYGALDQMDCVGMQYVEGTVPPLATAGDARDNDYRRYLPTMLQTYRRVVDASIPICVTSIGYFSGEGMARLPKFFEWAKDTTHHNQQTWLTEAMEWLSLQVDVRMALIWHIDWTNNPTTDILDLEIQRGYTILR